jgi:hypothetical protein
MDTDRLFASVVVMLIGTVGVSSAAVKLNQPMIMFALAFPIVGVLIISTARPD